MNERKEGGPPPESEKMLVRAYAFVRCTLGPSVVSVQYVPGWSRALIGGSPSLPRLR